MSTSAPANSGGGSFTSFNSLENTPALTSSATRSGGCEPRFTLPDTTPRSSKLTLVIAGIRVYVYGVKEALEFAPSSPAKPEVAVLYLAHNRTRTHIVTEGIAHEVLHRYRSDGRTKVGLAAVTMDMRNHGEREVSADSNLTWSQGNEEHAFDLLSLIHGGAHDFKIVMDFLPMHLPQFSRLHNIMGGVSLGGHVAWRMAALASPGQIAAYVMVVGCPNLTSLLLGRLGITGNDFREGHVDGARLDQISYNKLEPVLSTQQRRRWPRPLADLTGEGDKYVADKFPKDVPVLLCNGILDELVPASFTASWVESRRTDTYTNQLVEFIVQDNTGHSCTKEMVAQIASWLGDLFTAH